MANKLRIEPVGDMGYSLELKTSSRQVQTSKVVKEKILAPRASQNLKSQEKLKLENPFGQPYIDRHHELRQKAGDGPVVQLKALRNHQKQRFGSNRKKDDELVKHMSNLPGYLQRMERGENLQEMALNFGVLDWERLEKWKYRENHIPAIGNTKASSSRANASCMASGSLTLSSTAQSKNLAPQRKQPATHGSKLNSCRDGRLSHGVRKSQGKVTQLQDFETAQSTLDGKKNNRWKGKSSGRNYSEINFDRGKRKESDQLTPSEKEISLLNGRKDGFPLSSNDTVSSEEGKINTRVEEEFNLAHQHCPSEHQSIVLLLPKHSHEKNCSESFQLSETRTSFDGKLTEAKWKRLSDCFYPEELHSEELYSDIPHSCPLPVSVATNVEFDRKQFSSISAQGMEEPSTSTTIEPSKRLDEDIPEPPAAKGRHSSPSRMFSFSLSRMARSFSFKEGSAIPQLSSTYATVKSGPVKSEASAGLDNFNRDKVHGSSRARSSPLRRLLDPLLKPRGGQSVETVHPSKGNLNSVRVKPMNTDELLRDKLQEASSVQAFLQLTIKNGLHFFKLVADNSSEIRAVPVKKLPTSGKNDDSSLIYAFYSIHEIKKKSGGWINQGSKGKTCGFGYNIIAQMKVSSSYLPDPNGQNSKDEFFVRESVLYGVDLGLVDKEKPNFIPNTELAAIVVKNQIKRNGDGEQSDKSNYFTCKEFTESSLEDTCDAQKNENSKSTIVILPGGIHSLPNEGVPSPLINRWRSGGSCDCGGWDVGCKLQILTNEDQTTKISRPSISCSTADRFELFVEGGLCENKPIFSLAPLKSGLYSVEYDSSISLLQSFSICVAAISSEKSSDIFEENNQSEAKRFPEPMTGSDPMKTRTTIQGKAPAKYVPSPPPSPVGRV